MLPDQIRAKTVLVVDEGARYIAYAMNTARGGEASASDKRERKKCCLIEETEAHVLV